MGGGMREEDYCCMVSGEDRSVRGGNVGLNIHKMCISLAK